MRSFSIFVFSILLTTVSLAQHSISGRVTNAAGEGLIQASVFIENSYYAAITDDQGNYTLTNIPDGQYSLTASYVGYLTTSQAIDVPKDMTIDFNLGENVLVPIEINANRVESDAAFAHTNIDSETLAKENLGQDVPYLLRWTPSAVVTSDAGTGIGYTGIRLRGSDATRINVTINGVPLNDSESHGVFWVDLPDFASSVDNVQIQRGVGTSTNGAGAFGGSISLNTNKVYENPYIHANATAGSFNTQKLSVNLGTGLLNGKYAVDGRYSIIKSDGYVDRATSDLKSWYFSAARMGKKSSLRLLAFSGHERTYQSWYGSPESRVSGTDQELQDYYDRNAWSFSQADSINLFESGRTYNFYTYEDQVDDYQQDHYQLHYSLMPNNNLKVSASAFYTRGFGFFEEFKPGESYDDYRSINQITADNDTVTSGDLVRRRWLDNDFYGTILNAEYQANDNTSIQIGGALSQYTGDHFGNVVTAQGAEVNLAQRYYEGVGDKTDANAYIKAQTNIGNLSLLADLQVRNIDYSINGEDDDLTLLDLERNYTFFNPKVGITYKIAERNNVYASFAVANKEPTRGDFIDNLGTDIRPERLYDLELGYRQAGKRWSFDWNNYFMFYQDQLVLTGDVNNSGAFIKTNVGTSSRIGSEASVSYMLSDHFFWNINTTVSSNKVKEYVEDLGGLVNEYEDTDIAFSPSIIAANALMYKKNAIEVELSTKYVGKQYLDNTSSEDRKLPAYTYTNLRMAYDWNPSFMGNVKVTAMVNNLFDAKYSTNGYTYSYYIGETVTENFLYPQAGIHFMLGLGVEF